MSNLLRRVVRGVVLDVALAATFVAAAPTARAASPKVPIDLSAHDSRSGVTVRRDGSRLSLAWPMTGGEFGVLRLQFRSGEPLIEELGTTATSDGPSVPILRGLTPVTFLTVGTR